jgi:hypothetical protein
MRLFADHSVFAPGRVMWDNLDDVDVARPLHDQPSLIGCEDVLAVAYPNDVLLDVSFVQRADPDAHFVVAVVPRNDGWKPTVEKVCRSFDELTTTVVGLAAIARNWKK